MYDDTIATRTYYNVWYQTAADTVVHVYIAKSFKWSVFTFKVDSIKGSGDKRQALVTISRKTIDPAAWKHYYFSYVPLPITTAPNIDSIITTDSTNAVSVWFCYSTQMVPYFKNTEGNVNYFTNQYNSLVTNNPSYGRVFTLQINDEMLEIYMEKILGDPRLFNGANQLCRFHLTLRDLPPNSFINQYLR